MSTERKKLNTIMEIEGMNEMELLEQGVMDGLCYGICMNDGCNATYEYEPDSTQGWCDVCGTNSVRSALSLAGMI